MDAKIKFVKLNSGLYKITASHAPDTESGRDASIVIAPAMAENSGTATFLGPTRDFIQLSAAFPVVILQVYSSEVAFNIISLTSANSDSMSLQIEPLTFKMVDEKAPVPRHDVTKPVSSSPLDKLAADKSLNKFILHRSGVGDVASKLTSNLEVEKIKTPIEGITLDLGSDLLGKIEVEYKALALNGSETAWTKNGEYCGSRGHNLPLLGIAFRAKAAGPIRYDCEYQLQFLSGALSAIGRNGIPLKSPRPSDPVTHISLKLQPAPTPVAALTKPIKRAIAPPAIPKPAKKPGKL